MPCRYAVAGECHNISSVSAEQSCSEINGGKTEPCLGFHTATIVTYCTFDNVSVQRPLQAFSLEMISYHISPHEQGFR